MIASLATDVGAFLFGLVLIVGLSLSQMRPRGNWDARDVLSTVVTYVFLYVMVVWVLRGRV